MAFQNEPSNSLTQIAADRLRRFATPRSERSSQTTLEKCEWVKSTSLGIYLGSFEQPATEAQTKFFADNDTVILDPLQPNISAALKDTCGMSGAPTRVIGRIDLAVLLRNPVHEGMSESSLISSLDRIMSTVSTHFQGVDGGIDGNGFNGILLAGWEIFPIPVLNLLNAVLATNGLEVYLETGGPDFLKTPNVLTADSIAGLVIRNALMHSNGDRRDCFDMESLRSTVKSFISQACLRNFAVLVWETLDSDAVPSIAALKRTHTWCNFHSVVPWIGSNNALFDLSIETSTVQPLSAFDWLKERHVLELHDLWRNNRAVSTLQSASAPQPQNATKTDIVTGPIFKSKSDSLSVCGHTATMPSSCSRNFWLRTRQFSQYFVVASSTLRIR
jgi:hypothetical protein